MGGVLTTTDISYQLTNGDKESLIYSLMFLWILLKLKFIWETIMK